MKALLTSVFIFFSLNITAADSPASDAVITIKQAYISPEPAPMNTAKAQRRALDMCQTRGFNMAEALGEEKQGCERYTGWYTCYYRQVEQQYQCLNQ